MRLMTELKSHSQERSGLSSHSHHHPNSPLVRPSDAAVLQKKPSCACGGGCPRCQSKPPLQMKLEMSQPGDAQEREADRMADHVLGMSEPRGAPEAATAPRPAVTTPRRGPACSRAQRSAAPGAEGAKDSEAANDEGEGLFAPLRTPAHVNPMGLGAGEPLAKSELDFFEPRFGRGLGGVRVHAGAGAAESALSVGARAYAVGQDIVFASGEYAPHTAPGRRLLAHELAHTVQQSERGLALQRECPGHPEFCTPYPSRVYAHVVKEALLPVLVSYLAARISLEAAGLWMLYFNRSQGDSLTPLSFGGSSSVGQSFVTSSNTTERQSDLIDLIRPVLPGLCLYVPVRSWIDIPVSRLLQPSDLHFPINFNEVHTTPGNIAGGVGSSDAGPDLRIVSGHVSLRRTTDGAGNTTGGRLRTHFHFYVKDAVDLCPGDCGTSDEQTATIPLSRLEATGLVYDQPFEVNYDGPEVEVALDASAVQPCSTSPPPPGAATAAADTDANGADAPGTGEAGAPGQSPAPPSEEGSMPA
jgi:hypothetical protein